MNLLETLKQADVVCKDCGTKYGKYSVGCSSSWMGTCDVCGEYKSITEVRDYGYLAKGIAAEKLKTEGGILTDDEVEEAVTASYEQGDIVCKFTEAEITALADVLDAHEDAHPPGWNEDYDSAFEKIHDLFDDYCVKYRLSDAMKAYHAKYGTFGIGEDAQRWEGFRDAFAMLQGESND